MSEKKAPKLRFKGYTDDWVQCKLGEILSHLYNGQTPSRNVKNYWNGDIPWLTSGELNHGIVNNTLETISEPGKKSANLRLIPSGTIVIAITGLEAPGTRGNCAILGINTTVNQSVMALFVKNNIDTQFVFQWYKKIGQEYGIRYTQGTKQQSYNYDIVKILPISIPLIKKEQEKIGKLLIQFDSLITLQQLKIDQLNKVKKALLQQMFPEQDSKIPKTRFSRFTDPWEQRRLGEVADVRDGTHDSPKYINEGYPLLTSKNVGDGYINYDDVKYVSENDYVQINKRSKVDVNDILMGMIGTIGNLALIREEPDFAIKNVALIKHTSNFDYQFLFQELQTSAISKELLSGMDGGTQKFVSLKKIRNLSVMLPSENEQKKIGSYLMRFDSLIALHQRKLDQLKQVKKFLLQNMFI